MIDPDISTTDALNLLSTPDCDSTDRGSLDRRRFLQMVGWGVGAGAAFGAVGPGGISELLGGSGSAYAAGPLGANEGVLVLIGLYGGNDGLNTVVPYSNGKYWDYRSNIAIPTQQLHILNNQYGLHPNLTYLKTLFDQQKVAIVQGVGYPDPDLSHFTSMAYWMAGKVTGPTTSGWIGRWLDGLGTRADLYTAATIGSSLPLHLLGQVKRGTAVPDDGFGFGGESQPHYMRMYDGIKAFSATSAGRGQWHDALAVASRGQIDLARTVAPIFTPEIQTSELVKSLTVAARLINADLGFRVIDAGLDGFDNHSDEPSDHADRMQQLNDGVQAFFATLNPSFAGRVTLMTFSEFGRTPWSNDSSGTDHGTAAPQFVIGNNVKGGFYGQHPSLLEPDGSEIERWGRLEHTVDFRSLYATMIDGVLGGGSSTVLNGNFEKIDLFRPAPLPASPPPPAPVVVPVVPAPGSPAPGAPMTADTLASFVGLTPARLMDTRDAGGPIGAAGTRTLQVSGAGGVPGGAVAAVLNVTAIDGTTPSYLTVWPSDLAKPATSSLNTLGGDVVPNLVISKLSAAGAVNVYNNSGDTHCVVDVVGYFVIGSGSRFNSLSPARLLDTREGVGAPQTAVAQGAVVDLQVTGVGGVAADADAVVMNVTVTEPTASGFVTVWPTGATMPTASNLNFVPNQTVPNLVIAKLGAGGKVSLFNSAGSTQLIADVLGYFRPGDGARLLPLAPARLLDTRTDGGAAQPVGQTPLTLPVVGRGGVPAAGVAAVVLNVTATEGTKPGFVTVYPSGESRPMASNLNTVAGQTRANLVIAKVGADGAVSIFNSAGTAHLIADVVGFFAT